MDILFAKLEKEHPDHFAVKQYRKFKLAAGKTLKSILISCGARLAPFDIAELREIMSDDELELDTLGDRKTALFLIMSDTDTTFNFVIAMLQSQLSISFVTRRTTCTAAGCPFMCGAFWTSSPTSGRYPTLTS